MQCTPIQEDSPVCPGDLQMSSLPLRLSPPVEAANAEMLKQSNREFMSLEMPRASSHASAPKVALKRSPGEKEKGIKELADSNLNSTKVHLAFFSSL